MYIYIKHTYVYILIIEGSPTFDYQQSPKR